jgi:hypothetical protein
LFFESILLHCVMGKDQDRSWAVLRLSAECSGRLRNSWAKTNSCRSMTLITFS